jgi:hypothetical protein
LLPAHGNDAIVLNQLCSCVGVAIVMAMAGWLLQCARGNAIIAELSRLADFVPPTFLMEVKQVRSFPTILLLAPLAPHIAVSLRDTAVPVVLDHTCCTHLPAIAVRSFVGLLRTNVVLFAIWRSTCSCWDIMVTSCLDSLAHTLAGEADCLILHLMLVFDVCHTQTKYADIILDFTYFKNSEYYDEKINKDMVGTPRPPRYTLLLL